MARLTPAEITAIAEPLELVYQNMTDELLINIARHLKGGWEDTATWEMKKLGQLGALTEESAKIIAKYTGQTEEEIRQAFLQAASLATADIDPVLAQAAAAGKLVDPGTTVATSTAMQSALRSYVEQATDKLNLTNTTMLTSTQQVYAQTVHTAAVTAQLEQAKAIIETKSAEVITGQETRTRAMRTALNQLNSVGITGFYDRIGRKWQPDAYVNMVIKTTAHNAAITAIRTRQQEYGGGDIFQISSHPGARPLCAPYQGGFYSWSGSGVFTDGAGHTHEYDDINHTSYGEAAGIFGINCGHHPIPMIDGFSFPQEYEQISEEENARIYAESQEQRQLERDIRAAKREEEVCKAAGDEAGAKAARQKVQQEQSRMRQFIKDTGRVRRYDRESIGGGTAPTMPKVAQPKPAPQPTTPATWSDKVKKIRDDAKGNPTSDQIQEAGKILADEYKAFDKEMVAKHQGELDNLTSQWEAAKIKRDQSLDALYDAERQRDRQKAELDALLDSGKITQDEWTQRVSTINAPIQQLKKDAFTARQAAWDLGQKRMDAELTLHGTHTEQTQWLASRLSEVRAVGVGDLDIKAHLNNSRSPARKFIENAYRNYPADWVTASVNHGTMKVGSSQRGYYFNLYREIKISTYSEEHSYANGFHELGHRFEYVVPGIREQETAFYARRTDGEQLEWLGSGYRRNEKTRRDQFLDAYMGKDYGGTAYELVSMGLEYAYTNAARLAQDTDMQAWIYGLLLLR